MKKHTWLSLTVIVLSLIFTIACSISTQQGSGKVVTESRQVSGFGRVTLQGVGELNISQGGEERLTIEAEDNIIDKIHTEVRDGALVISFVNNFNIIPTKPIKFNVTMKDVRGIDLAGAGSVSSAGIKAERLMINISGSGGMSIHSLAAESLAVNLSGAGGIEIDGKVTNQDITLSGVGSYQASGLESDRASIKISGMGSGNVWANQNLDVEISGAGSLDYCGSPKITQHISGAGKVSGHGDCK